MQPDSYLALARELHAIGLTAQLMRAQQLVVSTQRGPVWPNAGNSFWLTLHRGTWCLGTWSPKYYRIPAAQDLVALCSACMAFGTSAMTRVPDDIVARFALEPISDDEFEQMFPDDDDPA